MKRLLLGFVVSVIVICAGRAWAVKPTPPPLDSIAAKATIDTIWTAAQIYYQDKGRWPISVEDLTESDGPYPAYLKISPAILKQWKFRIGQGPPADITAFAAEPEKYGEEMSPTVSYDVRSGTWSGSGIPRYHRQELTPDQQADLARDAIGTIHGISNAVDVYVADRLSWPETPEVLETKRYFEESSGTSLQWKFGFIGIPLETIVAVSTDSMPDGRGRVIEYDRTKNEWRGYGLSKLKALGDKYHFEGSIYVEEVVPGDSLLKKKDRPK